MEAWEVDEPGLQAKIDSSADLYSYIEQGLRCCPDNLAVSNMGASLSYGQLLSLSRDLAAWFQNCSPLRAGDRVALMMPNLLQYPVAVVALLRAGLVVVNINPLLSEDELHRQLKEADAKAIIVLANSVKLLEAVLPVLPPLEVIVTELADLHPFPKRHTINFQARYVRKIVPRCSLARASRLTDCLKLGARLILGAEQPSPDDEAVVQFTSGSSGKPRRVVLSHRNLIANLVQTDRLLTHQLGEQQQVVVTLLPLYHIYSFTLNLLAMLGKGHHLVLITNPADTKGVVKALSRCRFSVLAGLNALFVGLCRSAEFRQLDFSHLKLTISGGTSLTASAAEQWWRVTGCRIAEGYGLTEASPIVSVNLPGEEQAGAGRALPLTKVRVVDEEGDLLSHGEAGELQVMGPQVSGRVELAEGGWLATGDMARLRSDGILILDRKIDVIETQGFSVYPSEVENIICSHPDVMECCAIGVPCEDKGEFIKLFIVTENPRLGLKQVRDYARERLTSYKVPEQLEFRHSLPKNDIGKLLRRVLREEELNKHPRTRRHL